MTETDHQMSFAETLARVKAEYNEMPGLQLTPAQASRLWQLERTLSEEVLAALVDARFLVKTRNSAFARA